MPISASTDIPKANTPNPASAYCEQQGASRFAPPQMEAKLATASSLMTVNVTSGPTFAGVERLGITAELEQIADQIVASFEWEK